MSRGESRRYRGGSGGEERLQPGEVARSAHRPGTGVAVAARRESADRAESADRRTTSPITLLVDSEAFWQAVRADLAEAREYALFQTYSFEGDWVGTALTEALLDAKAPDRKLLIDSYTRVNQSDRWIPSPGFLFDREFREEVRTTRHLVATLRSSGVGVRFGRPFGFMGRRILRRDHRKLVVFDDRVAYVGGINFSEHNFEWHDFMVRVEDQEAARFLRRDFQRSWEGRSERSSQRFSALGLDLHALPGKGSREAFAGLVARIERAERSIHVISAYLGPPFTRHLAAAAARGVKVQVVNPLNNNLGYLQRYLFAEAARSGFELHLYEDRMIHMKCMLIDDEVLVTGSSNFDLLSYHGFLAETIAVIRSPDVIGAFRRRILEPALAGSRLYRPGEVRGSGPLTRLWSTASMGAANLVARALNPPLKRDPRGR